MKYLLAATGLALALASCATQKALPHYTPDQLAAQRAEVGFWKPDSSKAVLKLSPAAQRKLDARRRRGQAPAPLANDGGLRLLDDLLAVPPATPQPGRSTAFWQKLNPFRKSDTKPADVRTVSELPRKCKGCTIVYGNATVAGKKAQVAAGEKATVSNIEKKAGPAVVASDSSTQNALLGAGNLAAVHGDGNTLPQTATTQQAADWRATLAKPAGYVLAGLGTVLIVGGVIFLIVAYKRRNLLGNNGTV